MKQPVYQLISFLLHYPTKELKEALPDIQEEMNFITHREIRENIESFLEQAAAQTLDEQITHYVDHIDFGRVTSLYITYLKLGEQRERGLELLKLKKYYEVWGFDVPDHELADYLPIMLEFSARVPVETSNELLAMHLESLQFTRDKLQENESYYALLFEALLQQMEQNGVKFAEVIEQV